MQTTLLGAGFLADEVLKAQPWDTLLAIAVLATIAVIPLVILIGNNRQRHRTERLREEFGPDYDLTVNEQGNWRAAEQVLLRRHKELQRRNRQFRRPPT